MMQPSEPKPPLTLAAIGDQLRSSPALAVVSAVAVGFLVGVLLRCFERDRTPRAGEAERD